MKTLSQIGEIRLIQKISKILQTKDPSVLCGIGDDAAVLKIARQKLLFKTDALLESIHFDWRWADPFLLGRKSLSINLSDIAAMGGRARWAVISVALPLGEVWGRVEEFFRGLRSAANKFGVSIVGGDTDHSKDGWKVTVALVGEVKNPVYRSGARVGDEIWVTGFLGSSALGLEILRRRGDSLQTAGGQARIAPTGHQKFISAHLDPTPRLREGRLLSERNLAKSLIDVSDGLILDLEHLCEASRVGARVDGKAIPLPPRFLELCRRMKKDPLSLALGGGEDYELLFTASPSKRQKIQSLFRHLKTPVSCIGEIVSRRQGIQVLDEKGRSLRISKKGYQHF